jgi:hypothetical protein
MASNRPRPEGAAALGWLQQLVICGQYSVEELAVEIRRVAQPLRRHADPEVAALATALVAATGVKV